jgi:hypothetical protein
MATIEDFRKQKQKEQIAYNHFISKGYSPEASAGIVGNLVYESGLNTSAEGDIGYKGGSSFGIAQFRGKRLDNLKKRYGKNWTDFNNQLDFVTHELETTHQKANKVLKNTKNVHEAGQAFSDFYEVPAKKYKNNPERQKKVNSAYASLVGGKITQPTQYATPIADAAIKQANDYFEYLPTTDVKDLDNSENIDNLADESEENVVEEPKDKDIEEVEQQTKEYNFLREYQNLVNREQPIQEIAQEQQQATQQDLTEIYSQVSEFVDQPLVAQQGKLVENLKKDFGSKPKQMYLAEDSKEYRRYKERDAYYNPTKIKGITTGDWKQDLLYKNDWLLDVPIVGGYIKEQAAKIAKTSAGQPFLTPKEVEMIQDDRVGLNYIGDESGKVGVSLVDQYFSEKPLYPNAKYKPTSDYLEFLPTYSLKGNFEKDTRKQKIFNKEIVNAMFQESDKGYNEFIKSKKPVYRKAKDGSEIAELLKADLGGHKVGASWDEEVDLPYVSISDAWDFEPKAYSKKWNETMLSEKDGDKTLSEERSFIQSYLMHKVGNPFKVYDRFYFDPKTKKYIPDAEVDKIKFKKQEGGEIPVSSQGVYQYPEEEVIVPTKDGRITMQNVNYPILGIDEHGNKQMMYPNQEYKFDGKIIHEIPQLIDNEQKFLKYIAKTR